MPKIVDHYMGGTIQIDPMITHVLSLDEIKKGFDLMHARASKRSAFLEMQRVLLDECGSFSSASMTIE
jgi:hypothetical protein